jgi:hypothetical protein
VEPTPDLERDVRVARGQSLFREVNEQIRSTNEAFDVFSDSFTVACECCESDCLDMLDIDESEYSAIRANPRRFVVKPGHVDPDVEDVVREEAQYVVVEKRALAGQVAEALAKDEPAK